MPKKPNSSGQDQEYIPAGNGDASGEYADDTGQNRHFVVFANPLPPSFSTAKTTPIQNPKKSASAQTSQPLTAKQKLDQKVETVLTSKNIKTGTVRLGAFVIDDKKYDYPIEQAMAEQGFDGLPQVVDAKVFDAIVKKSKFVAQRGVGARSQAQLDMYTKQLYGGKWYISCNVGGAQYGQGMYCAADYTGKITQGVKNEATDYATRFGTAPVSRVETLTLTPDAKIIKHREMISDLKTKMDADPDFYKQVHDRIVATVFDFVLRRPGKPLTIDQIKQLYPSEYEYANHQVEYELTGDVKQHKKLDKDRTSSLNLSGLDRKIKGRIMDMHSDLKSAISPSQSFGGDQKVSMFCKEYLGLNDGTLATLMGYDAINAEGHGQSGSYTVILNRTKTIFKKQ